MEPEILTINRRPIDYHLFVDDKGRKILRCYYTKDDFIDNPVHPKCSTLFSAIKFLNTGEWE